MSSAAGGTVGGFTSRSLSSGCLRVTDSRATKSGHAQIRIPVLRILLALVLIRALIRTAVCVWVDELHGIITDGAHGAVQGVHQLLPRTTGSASLRGRRRVNPAQRPDDVRHKAINALPGFVTASMAVTGPAAHAASPACCACAPPTERFVGRRHVACVYPYRVLLFSPLPLSAAQPQAASAAQMTLSTSTSKAAKDVAPPTHSKANTMTKPHRDVSRQSGGTQAVVRPESTDCFSQTPWGHQPGCTSSHSSSGCSDTGRDHQERRLLQLAYQLVDILSRKMTAAQIVTQVPLTAEIMRSLDGSVGEHGTLGPGTSPRRLAEVLVVLNAQLRPVIESACLSALLCFPRWDGNGAVTGAPGLDCPVFIVGSDDETAVRVTNRWCGYLRHRGVTLQQALCIEATPPPARRRNYVDAVKGSPPDVPATGSSCTVQPPVPQVVVRRSRGGGVFA